MKKLKMLAPETIRRRMNQLAQKRKTLRLYVEAECDAMTNEEIKLQSRCPHKNVERVVNYEDSYTQCKDCGKEL